MVSIRKFPYAPRDERSDEERSALREVVREQIEPWVADMAADAKASASKGMTILRDRRQRAGGIAVELDDDQYPVVPYRLLVRRDDADGVAVDLTGEYAPQVVPIPELENV